MEAERKACRRANTSQLEGQRSGFQVTFALVFLIVALLFPPSPRSIFGINFREPDGRAIGMLIAGRPRRVRGGDLRRSGGPEGWWATRNSPR